MTLAVVRYVDRLTSEPQAASKAEINGLRSAGVEDADIVGLTQLAGFVNYQLRFIAGLRLISTESRGPA